MLGKNYPNIWLSSNWLFSIRANTLPSLICANKWKEEFVQLKNLPGYVFCKCKHTATFRTCLFIAFSAGEPHREFISENPAANKGAVAVRHRNKAHARKQANIQSISISRQRERAHLLLSGSESARTDGCSLLFQLSTRAPLRKCYLLAIVCTCCPSFTSLASFCAQRRAAYI